MQQELRRLFEDLPIGAVILSRDHRIRYVNQAFADFVHFEREELLDTSLLEITDSYDQDKLESGLDDLFEGKRKSYEMETRYKCKEGGYVWGFPVRMVHPNPLTDEERETVLMLVVDITEKRNLERQLRQFDKMNALGLLAGSIAHDFNNILTVISTSIDLMESKLDDAEITGNVLTSLRSACDRGKELTDQLLDFGRRESDQVEKLDVNALVRNIESTFARLLPTSIDLKVKLSNENPTVVTETGRLHQILMNLVLNARDAIEGDGTVTIETDQVHRGDPDFPDHDKNLTGDQYTLLRVCDSGSGMPPELIAEIFDPFFTTKGSRGSGMGLATVSTIVEEHRGSIHVDSTVGGGTCFEIYLPTIESIDELDADDIDVDEKD